MAYTEKIRNNLNVVYGLVFLLIVVGILLFFLIQSNVIFASTVAGEEIYNDHESGLENTSVYSYSAEIQRNDITQTTKFTVENNTSYEQTVLYSGKRIESYSERGTTYTQNTSEESTTYNKESADGQFDKKYGQIYIRQVLYDVQLKQINSNETHTTYRVDSSNRIDDISGKFVVNNTTNIIEEAEFTLDNTYEVTFSVSYDADVSEPDWLEENY